LRPKLNLATTILASSLLAVILNVVQFAVSYAQRSKDSFAPAWATTADATPNPSPAARLAAAPSTATAAQPTADTNTAQPAAAAPTPPADPIAAAAAKLRQAGLKSDYAALYLAVQAKTGTPWQMLAAVHKVETGQDGDTTRTSYAGATGPMQFMPATFNHYAIDDDGDGTKDIHDLDDAMYTAGRYLAASGASRGLYSQALYNYNHSWSYVYKVQGIYHRLGL
jgi:membrane-bound lytic murein transglycosylase B